MDLAQSIVAIIMKKNLIHINIIKSDTSNPRAKAYVKWPEQFQVNFITENLLLLKKYS